MIREQSLSSSRRLAVVLMNLGGPDSLDAVRPFLRNLFSDPAIIRLPWPLRPLLAEVISRKRNKKARKIYQQMGGASPILSNTNAQRLSLCQLLRKQLPGKKVEVFVAMRYWHPFTKEVVRKVKEFRPDKVVLLPLYPQFSTTTTGSSFAEWHREVCRQGLTAPTQDIKSYPQDPSFIEAHVDLITPWIEKAAVYGKSRILFSAHGLPQKVVDEGDPYEAQIHQTIEEILKKLPPEIESTVCYQSKVGPLKWLGPSTEEEIKRAGQDKVPIIVVPISFVSEHSETLVELDRDYRSLAAAVGVPFYGRVSTLSDHPAYIQALAGLVVNLD
jgi:ferrochelatase